MAWTLEDQLKLVNGSRWALFKYRLRQRRAQRAAERSNAQHAAIMAELRSEFGGETKP